MNIKTLVPWNWGRKNIPIRREEDHPVYSLQRTVNQVIDNFFEGFSLSPFGSLEDRMGGFTPRVDISESDKEFQVTAELPGMDEKNLDISLANSVLTLKGEKKEEKEDKKKDYYRMERSYGMFRRTIPLPEGVDLEKVAASFRKGVLTVTLPKTVEAQKEWKKIPIKAA
jgi:HSP20 family protein